jgi:hypothetical protein
VSENVKKPMPKYEVWFESITTHRAVIEAKNLDEARSIGWLAQEDPYIELEPGDTEYHFVSVYLLEGE